MIENKKAGYAKMLAQKKLVEAIEVENNTEYLAIRNAFIDKFTLCDLSCKVLLEQYKKAKKKDDKDFKLNLDMRTIPYAFSWAGVNVERHILNMIFGGSKKFNKRGSKSVKKIRNGIVHAMNSSDIEELLNRKDELMGIMDTYLGLFDVSNNIVDDTSMVQHIKENSRKIA